jgi:hypothetical protein
MEFESEEKQGVDNGRDKMSQEPKTGNLVDTTDCLEAVSVIRCWKNFLFIIILLALLLLQFSFWMVNLKLVKAEQPENAVEMSAAAAEKAEPAAKTPDEIMQEAKKAAQDVDMFISGESGQSQSAVEPNQVIEIKAEEPASRENIRHWFKPEQKHVLAFVRFLNFILIPASVLYCLTMLLSLKISLIGRLGGINHIARAFFLSLLFLVLLLPWQLLFSPVFAGAMFTPTELINACQAEKNHLAYVSMILRFTLYWLVVLVLLVLAQLRGMRWARTYLRRLEVI